MDAVIVRVYTMIERDECAITWVMKVLKIPMRCLASHHGATVYIERDI